MSRVTEQIRCQNCQAVNRLGVELCARCGTRLMIVHVPSAARFAADYHDLHDEHLLERVSLLENNLMRLAGKLEQTLDLLLKQARTAHVDHALLETLIGVLGETGMLNEVKLAQAWRQACAREEGQANHAQNRQNLRARILSGDGGEKDAAVAAAHVREGFDFLDREQTARGIRALERAAAVAPDNHLLHAFLGKHFFRAGKQKLAHDYLTKAYEVQPEEDGSISLLLGLLCGDEGDVGRAKDLLYEAVIKVDSSFAAHYALGRLFVLEENWKDALAHFRKALAARSCPEAYYVVGLAYLHLNRNRLAIRHLLKAAEMDQSYAEAFYALGLAHLRLDEHKEATKAFSAARSVDPKSALDGGRIANQRTKPKDNIKDSIKPQSLPPLLFRSATGKTGKNVITGGDARLAALVREDALKSANDFD
ncbi:MAG: tetratricopeptide repeat protein [Pyrinomonadaceae bacterium]|nr:tetratricopeptide repeat protein [Pyrinomonadaceae bacterium]